MSRPRRQHPRAVNLNITAVILARDERAAVFSVENLAVGGALLLGPLDLEPGEPLKLMLGGDRHPLTLRASVLRSEPRAGLREIAVAFSTMDSVSQERVDSLVMRTLEQQRATCAGVTLIVGMRGEIRDQLARDLASLGLLAAAAKTPLEATWQLEDLARRFDAAIVEFDRDRSAAEDVLTHLIVARSDVRRIILSDDRVDVLDREITAWRSHAYLRPRWTRAELSAALRHRRA